MDDYYHLSGCIDFLTDSYAISIPVLRKQNSNYTYIPKTDRNFIITDFYEISSLDYQVHYLPERKVSISEKTPVPILFGGSAYVLDADWSESEIRRHCPSLGTEAIKAFLSLRKRLADIPVDVVREEVAREFEDLLKHPTRSQYWISRLGALVRSAYEGGEPDQVMRATMDDARGRWLERFSTKASLKLVMQILNIPHMKMPEHVAKRVLLKRFEGLISRKGIFLPGSEIAAHSEIFPEGILPAIRAVNDQYDYWRMGDKISKLVNDQLYELFRRGDDESEDNTRQNPDRWSLTELRRFLEFFKVIGSDDFLLDRAAYAFHPVYSHLVSKLKGVLANRYEWTKALRHERINGVFQDELSNYSTLFPGSIRLPDELWLEVIGRILVDYRKAVVLQKIVRPHVRRTPDEEIAFEEFDHVLIDGLIDAFQQRKLSIVHSMLNVKRLI